MNFEALRPPTFFRDVSPLPVTVIASNRRKKTVAAQIVAGTIEVRVPANLDPDEQERLVAQLVTKLERQRAASGIDLTDRVRRLARRFDLPQPKAVSWSSRQQKRWGSCTPGSGSIRVSARLAEYPDWVLDYVLLHELAHLVEPGHNARFHELVARFPKAERAEGFLAAVSMGHAGTLSL